MVEYLYVFKFLETLNNDDKDVHKIGSTKNIYKRMMNYKTCFHSFDDKNKKLIVYKIIESDYSCYELDYLINRMSKDLNKNQCIPDLYDSDSYDPQELTLMEQSQFDSD